MSSSRTYDSRQKLAERHLFAGDGYPSAPDTTLRREVTQNDIDTRGTLPHNYTEDTDEYYFNTKNAINERDRRYSSVKRSFSEESPLVFQSTLSSLSKEENSSDGMEDINLSNTDSIFRPRQRGTFGSRRREKNVHLPNLLSHSNIENNSQKNEVNKYYSSQDAIQNKVTNSMNQSFDYSAGSNHPTEVVIDQSNKRRKLDKELCLRRVSSDGDYYQAFRLFGPAFEDFSYLLPGLKPFVRTGHSLRSNSEDSSEPFDLTPMEITIVKRRLRAAVFAFGGNMTKPNLTVLSHFNSNRGSSYRNTLETRFFDNQIRLSWDVEEKAPNEIEYGLNQGDSFDRVTPEEEEGQNKAATSFGNRDSKFSNSNQEVEVMRQPRRSFDSSKTKYRCKLCGQPKQNHICPYQQSLQRNIGTMSYPALNSFECTEPGKLAPSLKDMNNFINNNENVSMETNSSGMANRSAWNPLANVNVKTISVFAEHKSPENSEQKDFLNKLKNKKRKNSIQSSSARSSVEECANDVLMLPKGDLKPEQCKEVSISNTPELYGSYVYPTLPLTHVQRYSMSDSLFNLCKERFGLVEECSRVLDEAKPSESWDLAVAELTTQVLLILYCPERDRTIEGMRKYLLLMGISC